MKDGKPVIIEVKTRANRQSSGSAVRCVFVALHKCDYFLHSRELNFGHFGSLCYIKVIPASICSLNQMILLIGYHLVPLVSEWRIFF